MHSIVILNCHLFRSLEKDTIYIRRHPNSGRQVLQCVCVNVWMCVCERKTNNAKRKRVKEREKRRTHISTTRTKKIKTQSIWANICLACSKCEFIGSQRYVLPVFTLLCFHANSTFTNCLIYFIVVRSYNKESKKYELKNFASSLLAMSLIAYLFSYSLFSAFREKFNNASFADDWNTDFIFVTCAL